MPAIRNRRGPAPKQIAVAIMAARMSAITASPIIDIILFHDGYYRAFIRDFKLFY
jgi:hypothetical protein